VTEDTTNLVLEHLRAMRASLARIEGRLDTLAAETLALRRHQVSTDTLVNFDDDDIASIKVRLDRIERRLELAGPAE